MRDTAALAAQSDPGRNGMFHRRWTGPPPPRHRKGPGRDTWASLGKFKHNSADTNSTPDDAARRAVIKAQARAEALDRRARLMAAVGLRDAALRAEGVAAGIRAVLI
jgi:hypothetical protein